jgi:serine/threonine-protein kinase
MQQAVKISEFAGDRTDRFVIKAKLGSGAMGEVFLAEDRLLKRRVALKVIRLDRAEDAAFHHRMQKEAERASQLNDAHIAAVHDLIEQDGRLFLVMEYVEGQTLREKLREPLPTAEFFSIAEQCLAGVAAAHQHGIVHCDLKPENLMVTPQGMIKILDFGFAQPTPQAGATETLSCATVGGTPGYISPDQTSVPTFSLWELSSMKPSRGAILSSWILQLQLPDVCCVATCLLCRPARRRG